MADKPYKFLRPYTIEDEDIFFGRERETRILLYDVLVSRLVVLFAPTGTGKTSLINAGVWPRLIDRDYEPFYIRVKGDPAESAREALLEREAFKGGLKGESLAVQLGNAVEKLEKPIVMFFDQFEEFFTSDLRQEDRRQFIADMAQVYHNRDSGVHIVFSMREDFFVQMDAFREEIPTIFHNESNLRLRGFDRDQAREAIIRPAEVFGVEITKELASQLVKDLAQEGERIEPIQLQIVCDTLWESKAGNRIALPDYTDLGRAEQILRRRLEEDLAQNLDPEQLRLFERLLPELTTGHGTKAILAFDTLVKRLETDPSSLRKLVDRLDDKLRWLRKSTRYRELYIEWASDYLAERTSYLQERTRAISLRRLLERVMSEAQAERAELAKQKDPTGALRAEAATHDALESPHVSSSDFETLSKGGDLLKPLDEMEARFLFVVALEHGTHMSLWFDAASESGVDVWNILQERISRGEVQSRQVGNAILLLRELWDDDRKDRALELLEATLQRPALGSRTLEVLREMRAREAFALLEKALQQDALAVQAIDVLRRMRTEEAIRLLAATLRQEGTFALRAGMALNSIAGGQSTTDGQPAMTEPQRDIASIQAREALAEVLEERATSLFLLSLKRGQEMRFWFERASENDVEVWKILTQQVTSKDPPVGQAENTIRLLVELGDEKAEELLRSASQRGALARSAEKALSARQALESARARARQPVPSEPRTGDGMANRDWDVLLGRISRGQCTPILGSGVHVAGVPPADEIAQTWALEYSYPFSDSSDLAQVSQYLAVQYDPMFPKEAIIKKFFQNVQPPDFEEADEPHSVLASLPLPIYMTTNYHDFMARALYSRHREPHLELAQWNRYIEGRSSVFKSESYFEPTPESPIVFHLYGHTSSPESIVLTQDDYLNFLANLARDPESLPGQIRRAFSTTLLLFVGYSDKDWAFRVLLCSLAPYLERSVTRSHVFVQLPSPAHDAPQREARGYLERYFAQLRTGVYWGTARQFASELRKRWEAFSDGR